MMITWKAKTYFSHKQSTMTPSASFLKVSLLVNVILALILIVYARAQISTTPLANNSTGIATTETTCDVLVNDINKTDIDPFTGEPAPVDFESFPEARMYRTVINAEVEEGANFAGHYRLATWGCGTSCYGYAVVDLRTGKMLEYQPVFQFLSETGFSSSVTSNIMTFNPRTEPEPDKRSNTQLAREEGSAARGRIYYQMTDAGYLHTLCIENYHAR